VPGCDSRSGHGDRWPDNERHRRGHLGTAPKGSAISYVPAQTDPGAVTPSRFNVPAARAPLIPIGAGILGAFYLAFMALRAGDGRHFDVTQLSTAFALVAGLAIAAGITVLLRLGEGSLGARFALAAGTLVFAVLAVFSIGLAVLPIALLFLAFAVRQLLRRRSGRAVRAAVAGTCIGVAAVAYLLALNQPAVAECGINGSATSSGGLFGSTSLSSGGYSTVSGDSGGYIDEGDRIAYFTCQGGRMTDFHRVSLPQGSWIVTTQPSATVGRSVRIVFRVRPAAGDPIPADGLDFSVTCRTCSEPQPVVRGHADRTGTQAPLPPGDSLTFAAQVTFPAAGTWYTSPYEAPIEVRQ
jgi:hypothetical protein